MSKLKAKASPSEDRSGTMVGNGVLALSPPRLLDGLPTLPDEADIQTLRPQDPGPPSQYLLKFELDAWGSYQADYDDLVNKGYVPVTVLQVLLNDLTVGAERSFPMPRDPALLFPITLEVPQAFLREGIFDVSYQHWYEDIHNKTLSPNTPVRIDTTAPNNQREPGLRGPSNIDQAYLDGNNQQATFLVDLWPDVRLEDQAILYMQDIANIGDVAEFPVLVNAGNQAQNPFEVSIAAEHLRNGQFLVYCRLRDRSGNLGPRSNFLIVSISLEAGVETYQKPLPVSPYVTLWGWINCESLFSRTKPIPVEGLPFTVPGSQNNLLAGDTVELIWQMCSDRFAERPISPPYYFPPVLVSAEGANIGFRIHMNLVDQLIIDELRKNGELPENMEGSVRVGYRVNRAGVSLGVSTNSTFVVSLLKPGNTVCLGP
ncbi:hypothetical protein [Pseudomonas sp.]|uniref:hypothetical protein n=1 Tax=Pseudomonas sp. TaxID=306 RepID=UPI003D702376